jgi:hypothetical protein
MKKHNKIKLRLFESMIQATTVLNIPLAVLKSAKARGCPAFKHGRVSESVVGWIKKNPSPNEEPKVSEKERLQAEKLLKEIRALDFEHDLQMGKYELKETVKAGWGKGMEIVQRVMMIYIDKSVYNKAIRQMKQELSAMNF